MKKLFILLSFLTFCLAIGNAQTDYRQWEAGFIKAKAGQSDMFEKGIAAHNRKFHTADPYKVGVLSTLSGPHTGQYFVFLGPVTFTQIEGRPSGAEHDMDWEKNITPYVEEEGETSYWREDKTNIYRAPGSDNFTRSRFRNFTLLPGQRDRFEGLIKQVAAMYKAKAYPASYSVYWKYGASVGPHVITEISVDHWSYFDRPDTFKADFEEVNGAGSFERFQDEFELCIDRSKTFDELMVYKPNLSSE
jgi:hypothetical protein